MYSGHTLSFLICQPLMDYFERNFVYTYCIQPLLWRRYIDDIFMIWSENILELQNYFNHLNQCLPSINFESNISESEINFLNVKVLIKNNAITTSLFTKDTDTLSHLDFSSCHPTSCKKSIPYSHFLRLRRICSDEEDFVIQCRKPAKSFHKANCPTTSSRVALIRPIILTERSYSRDPPIATRTTSQTPRCTSSLIITHHSGQSLT